MRSSGTLRGGAVIVLLVAWALPAALAQGAGDAVPACEGADPKALAWLDRMSRSAQHTSYQGIATLQRGDEVQFMLLSHSVDGREITEHMTRLNGQGARVERDGHPLDCVHPGQKLLRLGRELADGRCGIAEYYRISTAEGERVAGRSAVRILVEPRDMYRYGYVMELDRDTALLLKVRVIGPGNRVLERFQFADLRYGGEPELRERAEVVHQAAHPAPVPDMREREPAAAWEPGWLPGGFTLTDTPRDDGARRSYTDGLAVFSVFLEAMDIRPGEGVVREGSTLSYTRGRELGGRSVLVTVVGEVPLNTARMVADSVTWTR